MCYAYYNIFFEKRKPVGVLGRIDGAKVVQRLVQTNVKLAQKWHEPT